MSRFLSELQLCVGDFSFLGTLATSLPSRDRPSVIELAGGSSHIWVLHGPSNLVAVDMRVHPHCSSAPRKLSSEQTRMSWGSSFKFIVQSLLSPYLVLLYRLNPKKMTFVPYNVPDLSTLDILWIYNLVPLFQLLALKSYTFIPRLLNWGSLTSCGLRPCTLGLQNHAVKMTHLCSAAEQILSRTAAQRRPVFI